MPPGARIDTNGVITWTPTKAQGPGTYQLMTLVWDAGNRFAFNSFTVIVVGPPPPLAIQSIAMNQGQVLITWNSLTNQSYRLQYCDSLSSTNWQNVSPDLTATGQTVTATNAVGHSLSRFFRVLQLP